MRKAVAIPYVIALVFGVIAIGVLGYWLISQSSKTIGGGITTECDALCVSWRNSGFNIRPSGIDRCPSYAVVLGVSVCAGRLGCDFLTNVGNPCPSGRIDYGPTTAESGRKVCCTG